MKAREQKLNGLGLQEWMNGFGAWFAREFKNRNFFVLVQVGILAVSFGMVLLGGHKVLWAAVIMVFIAFLNAGLLYRHGEGKDEDDKAAMMMAMVATAVMMTLYQAIFAPLSDKMRYEIMSYVGPERGVTIDVERWKILSGDLEGFETINGIVSKAMTDEYVDAAERAEIAEACNLNGKVVPACETLDSRAIVEDAWR